jgi:hypothetical protein
MVLNLVEQEKQENFKNSFKNFVIKFVRCRVSKSTTIYGKVIQADAIMKEA